MRTTALTGINFVNYPVTWNGLKIRFYLTNFLVSKFESTIKFITTPLKMVFYKVYIFYKGDTILMVLYRIPNCNFLHVMPISKSK